MHIQNHEYTHIYSTNHMHIRIHTFTYILQYTYPISSTEGFDVLRESRSQPSIQYQNLPRRVLQAHSYRM